MIQTLTRLVKKTIPCKNQHMKNTLFYGNFRPAVTSKLVIPALFALAVSCAHGAFVTLTQINNNAAPSVFQPLANDLLETQLLAATGENPLALVTNGTVTGLPVANVAGSFPAEVWGVGTTTYDFDLSINTLGYDITMIQAYSAWADRYDQSYRIFYAQVGDPTNFLQLGGDIIATGTVASSIITRTEDSVSGTAFLSGVSSIRFVQFEGPGLNDGVGTVYRELDVVGFASIPEPTTSVLGLGAAILLLYRRRS